MPRASGVRRALDMRRACLTLLVLMCTAAPASAQCLIPLLPPEEQPPCDQRYPTWAAELATLSANALLGGISAGVMHELRGGSFGDGFLRGLAGGAVVYGGKRIAVERFGGAGLVGRQVAAVGSSMVRNAGEGMGLLDRVVLPVGPVRLYVRRGGRIRVRADLYSLGMTVYAVQSRDLELDAVKSLSSGMLVFETNNRLIDTGGDTVHAGGLAHPGLLMIADIPAFGRDYARRVFEHERVHVLQLDQIFLTITDPLEDELMLRTPLLRSIEPYVDLNLASGFTALVGSFVTTYLNRPWETEAVFLSR